MVVKAVIRIRTSTMRLPVTVYCCSLGMRTVLWYNSILNLKLSSTLIFGKIKYVKDEIVTSTGFTNATPQRKVLFIDRVTG